MSIRKFIYINRILLSACCFLFIQACHILNDSGNNYTAQSLYKQNNDGVIPPTDNLNLSKQQKKQYHQDAEIIAARYINKKDSTQTNVPTSLINSLYNGLIHIITSNQPGVKKLTNKYIVHVHKTISPREILIFTDSTTTWLKAWKNGDTHTGNAAIDNLINQFNLSLIDYSELPHTLSTTMATLRSSHPLNTLAVSRLFQLQKDVKSAKPNSIFGDSTNIRVLFFDDHLHYTFELGFGDCIAGCINHHLWKYNVYHDGSVEFIKEEGTRLPD